MLSDWFLTETAGATAAFDYPFDPLLVAISGAIAIFASLTSFNTLERYRSATEPRVRLRWLITGAASLGSGIWAMHFVAIQAMQVPMETHYDTVLTVFSAVIAILASGIGLKIAEMANRNRKHLYLLGGVILGAGIGTMHYAGMTAMHIQAEIRYDPLMFGASILIAVALSTLTLWLLNISDASDSTSKWYRFGCAVLMGLSIAAMHYAGMDATYFTPASVHVAHSGTGFSDSEISTAIVAGAFLLIQTALVTAIADRHMQAQSRKLERSEGLLQAIVRNTAEAIIAIDQNGAILSFNNAAVNIFGYTREEVLNKNISMLMMNDMNFAHDEFLSDANLHSSNSNSQQRSLKALRKNGETFQLELTVTRVWVQQRNIFVSVCRDTTQRLRMEGSIRLLQRVAVAANEAVSPLAALQVAIDEICKYADWEFGHAYIYDETTGRLEPSGIWYPDDPECLTRIKQLTMQLGFEPGIGLPGYIFENNTPYWINDIASKMARVPNVKMVERYPRATELIRTGLKSAFAFPISVGGQVVAVLEFYSTEVTDEDRQLLDLVSNVAAQIGRVFEREISEKNTAIQQQFIHSITLNLFEGVLVVNQDGIIEFSNLSAHLALSGSSCEDLTGQNVDDVFHLCRDSTVVNFYDSPLYETMGNRETYENTNATFMSKEGKTIPVAFACSPIQGRNGEQSVVISFRDISELRKAQSDALQASKLASVGELAAGIAHEINSPIQFIGDNLSFIQETSEDIEAILDVYEKLYDAVRAQDILPDEVSAIDDALDSIGLAETLEENRNATEQSLRGVKRIARIVQAMKEFSHPGSKQMVTVDLNHAIISTVEVCRNEWKTCADMDFDLQEDMPAVRCFAGELNQVFLNIIVNAAHAIRDAGGNDMGCISISTRQQGDWATIRISDTGGGIPVEIRDRIFDPFFTTKEVGKGSGQGLSISHDVIVGKHNGKIEFDSEMGHGTTFIISIPLNGAEIETEAA